MKHYSLKNNSLKSSSNGYYINSNVPKSSSLPSENVNNEQNEPIIKGGDLDPLQLKLSNLTIKSSSQSNLSNPSNLPGSRKRNNINFVL
jgi:hypothetical protein